MERNISSIRRWLENHHGFKGNPDSREWQLLLGWHPTWKDRISEIKAVRVRNSRLNGSIQLQISLNGTRFYTISWHACVRPPSEPSLEEALREAVNYQIKNWKRESNSALECKTCQATSSLQVDHCLVPLKHLIEQFLFINTIAIPSKHLWGYNPKTHAPRLPSSAFVRSWRNYHLKNAHLQYLCRTCNARKGSRN